MPEPDYILRQGDAGISITSTLKDADGNAVNLNGATVRLHVAPIGGGATIVAAAASNDQVGTGTDGSKGKVSYVWQSANSTATGLFIGEWQVTYSGGAIQTFPNGGYVLIRITAQVA